MVQILVFSKESTTVYSRVIHRVPIRLTLSDGSGVIDAVRYDTKWWPIYKPESFDEQSKRWVSKGDTLYGPAFETLKQPLEHAYLFECDDPRGGYAW